jgi:DNA-binding LacI/PurR family transcriptional regulator
MLDCAQVGLDNIQRSFVAVKHLYELGHQNISILFLGMENNSLLEARLWGFERAMKLFNLEVPKENILILPFPLINGKRKQILKPQDIVPYLEVFNSNNSPTALIINDNAPLFVEAFKLLGINIPNDLSLVSGSNIINEDEDHETYVLDRLEDICSESAKLIVEMIENKDASDYKKILIPPKIIPGFSTTQYNSKDK